MNYSVKRVGDSSYIVKIKNQKKAIRINVDSKNLTQEEKFRVAKESAAKIHALYQEKKDLKGLQRLEGVVFQNKNWKISKEDPNSTFLKLAAKLTGFFHPNDSENIEFLKVSEEKSIGSGRLAQKKHRNLNVSQVLDGSAVINLKLRSDCVLTPSQYDAGVRDIIRLEDSLGFLRKGAFSDPYTCLATEAFQVYEKDFTPKDDFTPDQCAFILVEENNQLLLVDKSNKELNIGANHVTTLENYRSFLVSEYGEEKVRYIEYLYQFSFDDMIENQQPLTPEHVYRMNIGVQNIEMHDLNHLLSGLHRVNELFNEVKHEEAKRIHVQNLNVFLTGSEIRGVLKRIDVNHKALTVYELMSWLKNLDLPDKTTDLLPHQMGELMRILTLNKEETKRSFTGRKIEEEIKSGSYTTAELTEYKPWVDQQELLQVFPTLIHAKTFESYLEKLTHLVVKKQLVREHPTEGYRVGALIPAMKDKNGDLKWYKVSSFVSNGKGIVSYSLESACNDPSLPIIKLYRSTASSLYALQSSSTLLHDLNSMSSPGYEGLGLSDAFESDLFHQTTIPLWVGYAYQAQREENPLRAMDLLKSANLALQESHQRKYVQRDLKQILRSNDALLNELLLGYNTLIGILLPATDKGRYFDIYRTLVNRYIRNNRDSQTSGSKISLEEQKKDAEALKRELLRLIPVMKDDVQVGQIRTLIDQMDEHILTDRHLLHQKEAEEVFRVEIYHKLENLQRTAEFAISRGDEETLKVILSKWQKMLDKYARSQGESVKDKADKKVILTGHSLGGACAQSHLVHYTTNQMRIPLPGQAYEAFVFCDPAINEEDNRSFLQFGNQHHQLLNAIGSQFIIQRRQAVGDFVPAGGEVHLGAAFSEQEERDSARWLRVENRVRKKLPGATNPSMAQTTTSHGMKFGEAVKKQTFYPEEEVMRGEDYIETWYSNYVQGIFDQSKSGKSVDGDLLEAMWKDIYVKLWQLPGIDAVTVERIRTNVLLLIAKNMIYNRGGDHLRDEFTDEFGVLAVNEQGVQSIRKERQKALETEESSSRKTFVFQAQAKASQAASQRTRMDQFLKSVAKLEKPKLVSVVINTETSVANHLFEFVIHQGCIWTKKIGESPQQWTPMIFDGKDPVKIRCDGANLIVLDKDNDIHYKKVIEEWRGSELKKDPEAQKKIGVSASELANLGDHDYVVFDKRTRDNWKKDWCSLPVIGLLSKGRISLDEDTVAWDISHRGRFGDYYTDGFHQQEVATGVTTLYVLSPDKKTIAKYDPWSPKFAEVNLDVPETVQASYEVENLRSAGAMMMMVGYASTPSNIPECVNKELIIKTMFADIDVLGWNPFLKYDYFPHEDDPEIRVIPVQGLHQEAPLSMPHIIEHPLPEGAVITKIISIVQTGQGNDTREMRVAGWNNEGVEGYYRKKISDEQWEFVASLHKLPIDQAMSPVYNHFPTPFNSSVRSYDQLVRARLGDLGDIKDVKLKSFGKGSYDSTLHMTISGKDYDFFIHRKHTFKNFVGIKGSSYDLVIPEKYHQDPDLKKVFSSMVIPLSVKEVDNELRISSSTSVNVMKKPTFEVSFKLS